MGVMIPLVGLSRGQVHREIDVERPLAFPAWIAGGWYDTGVVYGGSTSTLALVTNQIYASPIGVPRSARVNRIGIYVTTAGAASTIARLMLYETAENGLPGDLLFDAGTVPVDTVGEKELIIDVELSAKPIYGAVVSSGAPTLRSFNISTNVMFGWDSNGGLAAAARCSPNRANGSTVAPDPFGSGISFVNNYVRVGLRAA